MSNSEEMTDSRNVEESPVAEEASSEEAGRDGAPQEEIDLAGLFEALLFLSNEPLPLSFFVKNLGVDAQQAKILLDSLVDEYEERDGGIRIVEISNGFQFMTSRRYSSQIRSIMGYARREGLSKGMLETLSIIAYKQPVIRADIEAIRGVGSGEVVNRLREMALIRIVGRAEIVGRPILYGTTRKFLDVFGLADLDDLPPMETLTLRRPPVSPATSEETPVAAAGA